MSSRTVLTILRVLVVVIAAGIVGVGIWTEIIIRDIDSRGFAVLDTATLASQAEDAVWRSFMHTAMDSQLRIWIAIATSSFSALSTLLTITSFHNIQPLRLTLSILSTLSLVGASASTISQALKFPSNLPPSEASADLSPFAILLPISRALAVTAAAATLLSLTTTVAHAIQTIHRARDSKACSFEPTASALGMRHGYAVDGAQNGAEEKGLAGAGAEMGGRESVGSRGGSGSGECEVVSWPAAVAKRAEAANIRPHRPWSEMPKP